MSHELLSLPVIIVAIDVFSVATTAALHRWGRGRLALSGVEYLLVGALAGPFVLGLLDEEVMTELDPIVSVILGVGLLVIAAVLYALEAGGPHLFGAPVSAWIAGLGGVWALLAAWPWRK